MQNIQNGQTRRVASAVEGFLRANASLIRVSRNPNVLVSAQGPAPGKVGVVSGARDGREPGYAGFLGKRMLDAVALGHNYEAPSPTAFFDAFREADSGAGVVCLLANNAEDRASVAFATLLAARDGIEVATVMARDDVCSAPLERHLDRRGGAGLALMWKVAGSLASLGADLDEVRLVAQRAIDNCRTVAIGFDAPSPRDGRVQTGVMEIGIGHHGERGVETMALQPAAGMARQMLDFTLDDRPRHKRRNEIAVLLSGLGRTALGDVYTIYDSIFEEASLRGQLIHRAYVGNYFTAAEPSGATFSVMELDEELKGLLDMQADCIAMR